MSEHAIDNNDDHGAHEHIVPIPTYAAVFGALVILMALTVYASTIHFPGGSMVNNIVAMGIAVTKASLVVGFFMGYKYSTKLVKIWILLGFIWLPLMSFIYADYTTRQYEQTQIWNDKDKDSALPRDRTEPVGSGDKPMEEQTDTNLRPRF